MSISAIIAAAALLASALLGRDFEFIGAVRLEEPGDLADVVVTGAGPTGVELLVEHRSPNPHGMGAVRRWRRIVLAPSPVDDDPRPFDTDAPVIDRASPGARFAGGVSAWTTGDGVAVGRDDDVTIVPIAWDPEAADHAPPGARLVSVGLRRLAPRRALASWHVVHSFGHHKGRFPIGGGFAVVATDTREFVASVRGSGAFGRWVSTTDDVDGDGVDEVLVVGGMPDDASDAPAWKGERALRVISSATGEELRASVVAFDDRVLLAAEGVGDVDGDGVAECALGVRRGAFSGELLLVDGASGVIRATQRGDGELGTRLARVPDIDGDGLDDLLATAAGGPSIGVGRTTPVPPGRLVLVSTAELAVLAEASAPDSRPGDRFGTLFDVCADPRTGRIAAIAGTRRTLYAFDVVRD